MELFAFINGKKINKKEKLEIINPSTNLLLGTVPMCDEKDIDNAFKSANDAFNNFKYKPIEYREDILRKIAKVLIDNTDELANIIANEIAKPIKDAKSEVIRSVDIINQTIDEYRKIYNNPRVYTEKDHQVKNKIATYNIEPVGVVLAITPFNYPINLLVAKLAPAIMSGNTIVIKSASSGSLVTSKFIELIHSKGIDNGIINLVTGAGKKIGDYIIQNKYIRMISFTGSTNVAKKISQSTSMIPLVLENGGKDPAIVYPDADLNLVVKEIINGAFSFSGQRCTAIKRVIAHESIYSELISKLNKEINKLVVGYPYDQNVFITPLINQKSLEYNLDLISDAKNNGATLNQEIKFDKNLLWPILVSDVNINMRIWKEEPFGPILPIISFKNEQESIALANDSNYGLQASIFTNDKKNAIKISKFIEAGTININKSSSRGPDILPFFGIKDSGFGIQGIHDAILSMNKLKGIIEN